MSHAMTNLGERRTPPKGPRHWSVQRLQLFLAMAAVGTAGPAACTWDVDFLDSNPDAGNDAAANDATSGPDAQGADAGPTDEAASDEPSNDPDAQSGQEAAPEASPYPPGDIILNGGFEMLPLADDWSTWNGVLDQVPCPRPGSTGSYGGRTSQRMQLYAGPVQDVSTRIDPSATYQATAWAMWGVGTPPAGFCTPPGADAGSADGSADGGTAEGGVESGVVDAIADAGSADPPDAADAAADASQDANDSGGAAAAGPQELRYTAKVSCPGVMDQYIEIGVATGVPEWTWVELSGTYLPGGATAGCLTSIYIENADIGLDLYVDDVSLTH